MPTPKPTKSNKFCVWAVNFMEDDEGQYGDCTAVLQYNEDGSVKHCVLIDCAKAGAAYVVVRKLKAHGVKKIDAVCISHGHGDHYGGLNYIMKHIPVSHIYVPDITELAKYQKSYASAIKSQAKKAPSTYLKAGTGFSVGDIKCKCVFICPANKLSEHDNHHFVNNESMVLRFDLDGVIYHTAGDLQNPANNVLIKTVKDLKADIFKAQWHGDANACNDAICKAVRPKYAFSNYHHKPSMSGRGTTRKRLQAVGAKFYDNYTYGDIFFNIQNGNVSVKTSKKG
jgi:beta-lactamase superfamily II metal-dependent hydrolase